MALEKILIRVIAKVTGERDIDKLTRKITRLGDTTRGYGNRLTATLGDADTKWKKHFDFVDKAVRGMGGALTKFVGMSAKFATVQVGALGVAMMAVHAAFVLGNAAMKAFRGIAQLATGAMAGLTVALAAASAAMREQQAAMYAYRGVGKSFFGSGINQVRVELRGLMTDAELAAVGTENLMGVFGAVSKKGVYTQGTQQLLKGLMDFATAGQDIKTGSKAAGDLLATLTDPKAGFSQVTEAAKALGPQMEQALAKAKEQGVDTVEELKKAILDGSLAAMGGVQGQFDAFNSTLINQGKALFSQMKEMFADMGQPFLEPLKVELQEVALILRSTFTRVIGDIDMFAKGSMIDNISVVVEKLANFFVNMIHEYMPKVDGMFSRMGEWWDGFKEGWNTILDNLRPLIDGAKVLEKTLMEILRPAGDAFGHAFTQLNDLIVENEEEFVKFGRSIGGFISEFSEFSGALRAIFVDALPFMTKIVDGATALFDIFTSVLGVLTKITGGLGSFGPFGMISMLMGAGRSMRGTIGGRVPTSLLDTKKLTETAQTQQMQVTAQQVLVNGPSGMRSITPTTQGPVQKPLFDAYGRPLYRSQTGGGGGGGDTGLTPAGQVGAAGSGTWAQRFGQRWQLMKKPDSMLTDADRAILNQPSKFTNFREQLRNKRANPFNTKLFGGKIGDKDYKGWNKSMGASMAASLGLGLMSNFAGPEAQGALALGSTVGMFNPVAGAMVGLGGTALTSTTIGGGMLAGAGTGAMIGKMLPIPGGAMAGAVMGALVGGIAGFINGDKKKKREAREAGKRAMGALTSSALDGFSESIKKLGAKGMTTKRIGAEFDKMLAPIQSSAAAAQKLLDADTSDDDLRTYMQSQREKGNDLFAGMTDADFEKALKKPEEFFKQIPEQAKQFEEASNIIQDKYTSRLKKFAELTGQSEEEVVKLADAVGVNLFDATMKTEDMVKKLASGMIDSLREMQQAAADRMGEISTIFGRPAEQREAADVIQEIARNIYDVNLAGGLQGEAGKAFLGTQMQSALNALTQYYGGDTKKAESEFFRQFGKGGVAFSQVGGPLAGMGGIFQSLLGPEFAKAQSISAAGRKSDFMEFIGGNLAGAGLQLGAGQLEGIGKAYGAGKISEDQETLLINYLSSADLTNTAVQKNLQTMLQSMSGVSTTIGNLEDPLETSAVNLEEATEQLKLALETIISKINPDGDTRTRRAFGDTKSNLSNTLASHNALSSGMPGKRIITSSYRNFALGSLKSDHLTGNALDLVGDNLVSYRDAIRRSGGFAEFHGGLGKSRHLHAVPGSRAIGDSGTFVSAPTPQTGGSGGAVVVNNTFNISGVDGSREELANSIIAKIRTTMRDVRERQ